MASVSYDISIYSGTNSNLPNGGTLSGTITRSGDVPKGAYVISATLYVSRLQCYTSSNARLQIGGYGTSYAFTSNSSTHGETVSASVSDSILSVDSESITLTVQSGNSGNALNIRDGVEMTLTVEYEISAAGFSASTGTLSSSSVAAGSTISISLSNANLSDCNHTVYWYCGSYNSTSNLSAGTSSASLTIPMSWLNAITKAESGTGYVRVTTKYNGQTVGSNTYSYTIVVPDSVVPTIGSLTITRIDNTVPSGWGIYVQNKSGAKLTVNSCTGVYGSTISSYTFSGGASATTTSNTYTQSTITSSGTVKFTVKVTDSRGRTASISKSVSVVPYSSPSFTSTAAFRCDSAGTASETGTYIAAKSEHTYSNCSSKNTLTASVSYSQAGYNTWTTGANNITSGTPYVFGGGKVAVSNTYQVKFVLKDTFTTVEKIVDVLTASYTIFFKEGGMAIGLGMESSADAMNVIEVNPDWDIERDGVKVFAQLASGGVTITNNLTTTTTGTALDAYQGRVLNNKFSNYFLKSNVIYSSSTPTVVNGAIWLKPI